MILRYLDKEGKRTEWLHDATTIDVSGDTIQGQLDPADFSKLPSFLAKGVTVFDSINEFGYKDYKSLTARALKVLYQLRALQAVKDKHGREGKWITVKGTPVFIEDGQTADQAIKEKFGGEEKKESDMLNETVGDGPEETEKPVVIGVDSWDVHHSVQPAYLGLLEETWDEIPQEFRNHIRSVMVTTDTEHTVAGLYSPNYESIEISANAEAGLKSTLWHEVQHHRWYWQRNGAQKEKWDEGVRRIMAETGTAPTRYVEKFLGHEASSALDAHRSYINNLKKAIKTGDFDEYVFHGPIYGATVSQMKILENRIYSLLDGKDIEDLESSSRYEVERYQAELTAQRKYLTQLDAEFEASTPETRIAKANKTLESVPVIPLEERFLDEAHSEVGAYIYEKEDMLEYSGWNPSMAVNEDVIEKYAKLYKDVFGK